MLEKLKKKIHNQIKTHVGWKRRREEQKIYRLFYIHLNLFGEVQQIPLKTKIISNCSYIQFEKDGQTYFKALSLKIS